MDLITFIAALAVGFVGGAYSATVGGYALLVVPTLIFLGLSPHEAIATDKVANLGMAATSWSVFHKKKLVNYKIGAFTAIFGVAGAVAGAFLLLETGADAVKKIIAIATIVLLFIIMAKKDAGVLNQNKSPSKLGWALGAILSFAIGVYGGFYGGGYATIYSYLLILLFGQTFLESAGTRKIGTFLITLASVIVLGAGGKIVYSLAIPLLIVSSMGAYAGAHYAVRLGNVWVKRAFFVAVLAMAIKLLV